jgi:hypothetical protein
VLLVTDPKRRHTVLERPHAAYLQLVPFRAVAGFTLLQLLLLAGVWALTTFGGVRGARVGAGAGPRGAICVSPPARARTRPLPS